MTIIRPQIKHCLLIEGVRHYRLMNGKLAIADTFDKFFNYGNERTFKSRRINAKPAKAA